MAIDNALGLRKRYSSGESIPLSNAFDRAVNNRNSVIMAPWVNDDGGIFQFIKLFAEEAVKLGVPVRKGWGRHMTLNRFTETIPPEEMDEFRKLIYGDLASKLDYKDPTMRKIQHIKRLELRRNCYPESVNMGYFINDREEGFKLHTCFSSAL